MDKLHEGAGEVGKAVVQDGKGAFVVHVHGEVGVSFRFHRCESG